MNRFTVCLLCAAASPAMGEELPFNPDRPGFADSTGVAPAGHVLTEFGVTVSAPDKATALTVPDALVRFGVADGFEARLVLPTFNRVSPDEGDAVDGFGDAAVGAKWSFEAGPMAFGLVGTLVLPTGSDTFTSDSATPVLGLNFGLPLDERFSLGGVVGADLTKNGEGDRVVGTFGSLSVGAALNSASVYLEAFMVRPNGGPAASALNLGGTYALSAVSQLDVSVTIGLDDGPANGLNIGTSWLW